MEKQIEIEISLHPVAYLVYWGVENKRPSYPAYETIKEAEETAACIKSNTEIRALYSAKDVDELLRKFILANEQLHLRIHQLEKSNV